MPATQVELNKTYKIKEVNTDDEMRGFLLTLGCYPGEEIIIKDRSSTILIEVKNCRYGIDYELASAIILSD